MKLRFMLLIAAALSVTTVFAQKEEKESNAQVTPPAAVKTAFAKKFPGITAKWEEENGKFEANFKQQGHEMSALFDNSGTMEESEMEIKTGELPSAVITYISQHYKGAAIKEAAKITKASGEVNYEAEVKGKDLIFDASGKFLKEAED